jgi:hypothetical protein
MWCRIVGLEEYASSETYVINLQTSRRHIPGDGIIHSRRHEILKSHNKMAC